MRCVRQLGPQALGVPHDGELGGGIGGEALHRRDAVHGRDVHHVATRAAIAHGRAERAAAVDHPHEIDAEHPFPILRSRLQRAGRQGHPGVVDEDVERVDLLVHRRGEAIHRLSVGHVDPNSDHLGTDTPERLLHLGQPVLVDVADGKVRARLRRDAGDRLTDAAGRTGDPDPPSGEILCLHVAPRGKALCRPRRRLVRT